MGSGQGPGARESRDLESTTSLLARIRDGDRTIEDRLIRRFEPALRRWAHNRLPPYARSDSDTDDLVQMTLLRALKHIKKFEPRRPGAFLAYLQTILINEIKDRARRNARQPPVGSLPDEPALDRPSQLEQLIGHEKLEAYEAAKEALEPQQRLAIFLRIELGLSYAELAEALDSPSPDAARMVVVRAVRRLVEVLNGK